MRLVAVAEDLGITRIAGLTWDQWNASLAMPLLVAQMREGAQPLSFSSNETSRSPTSEHKYSPGFTGNDCGSSDSKALDQSNGVGYPCPDCGRFYKLKSSLRNHQKWECGKEPQFQCPFCPYKAKQKMHIGRHLERMHKDLSRVDLKPSLIDMHVATTAVVSNNEPLSLTTTSRNRDSKSSASLPNSVTVTPMPCALNLTNTTT